MSGVRLVYVAHPLSGPTPEAREVNRKRAARWVAWIAMGSIVSVPIAPWVTLAEAWPEDNDHRAKGIEIDLRTISRCDEVWLVGGRISTGMAIEAEHAKSLGIPVIDLTSIGEEPPT